MIKVIYWSQKGNTEEMAKAVAAGITEKGKEAKLLNFYGLSSSELDGDTEFAMGCPAMGGEELEESDVEPFVEELTGKVSGKKIALFGSFGWGDGEWMRNWAERMSNAGAVIIGGEGVICQGAPDTDDIKKLKELGNQLAEC